LAKKSTFALENILLRGSLTQKLVRLLKTLIYIIATKETVPSRIAAQKLTRVIGLISGTSVDDGIDAALVDIGTDNDLKVELIAGKTYPYPDDLKADIGGVWWRLFQ